ncbi:MAG: hypothetical protein RQM92_00225 [Candidatus Syntrophopropionicum ammoniitolerans]
MKHGYNPEMDRKLVTSIRYEYSYAAKDGSIHRKTVDGVSEKRAMASALRIATKRGDGVLLSFEKAAEQPEHLQAGYHPRDSR